MKIKNNKKVFIITIVAIVLVVLIGGAYAFLATDMFKSNKELFFEYAAQIFNENGFIDGKLEQYNSKKNNRTYENEGKLTFNINSENVDSELLENINNLNISFAGNTDTANNKKESVIKVNYSDEVNFPIYYKRIDGISGLKIVDVSKTTYFAIKDGELGKFMSNVIGSNVSFEESLKPDISNLKLTKEEQNNLKETYIKIIEENIDNSSITKINKDDLKGYTLEISNKNLKEILRKIFEQLKNDELMLNKLSKIIGTDINAESIQNMINFLNLIDMEEGNTSITLYGKNKELRKIEIKIKDELNITISKEANSDENKYKIEFENVDLLATLNIQFTGLKDLNNVTENYEISFEVDEKNAYKYSMENQVRFNEDIDIRGFKEKEYIDLNNYNKEKLSKLLRTIGQKIESSNKEKLEEAEIKSENPVLSVVPGLKNFVSKFIPLENEETPKKDNEQEQNEKSNQSENQNENSNPTKPEGQNQTQNQEAQDSNMVSGMEQLEKNTFNAKIKQYEGENVKGPTVKSLFMQIIASNMAMEDRQIEVIGDIKLNGDQVPDTIVSSKIYTVKCFTGTDGYINKVEVKEKAVSTTATTTNSNTTTSANVTVNNNSSN